MVTSKYVSAGCFIALGVTFATQARAGAISPSASLIISLANGSTVTASGGTSPGLLSPGATISVSGTRYISSISSSNIGVSVNDTETIVTGGSYTAGTYSNGSTNLDFIIDGLEFAFTTIGGTFVPGSINYQFLTMNGQMLAGTNSVTHQQYNAGLATLGFTLQQLNSGGSIGYSVTLNVSPIPEPASLAVLAIGLAGLGLARTRPQRPRRTARLD